jgi:hypothetical protein
MSESNNIKLPEMGNLWYPCLRDKQLASSNFLRISPAVQCKTLFYAYNSSERLRVSPYRQKWERFYSHGNAIIKILQQL